MFGTLRGALAGRKIAFDRDQLTAAVEAHRRVTEKRSASSPRSIHCPLRRHGAGATRWRRPERALAAHPRLSRHESVKGAIEVTWIARVRAGSGPSS